VGLLATAEDLRGADTSETNAMGLMGAHAACEAMLGLMAAQKPYPKGKPSHQPAFPVLLEHVATNARPKLPQGLRDDLLVMHDVRNSFVHGGTAVDRAELDRAIEAAHSLADHVPLPGHKNLVAVPTVVADIIDFEVVGMWLRHADVQRAKGNLRLSADGIARALDSAIDHTEPDVVTRTGQSFVTAAREQQGSRGGYGWNRAALETTSSIAQLTKLVVPMALGTAPSTLTFIRNVVGTNGREDAGGYPVRVWRPSDDPPSSTDLRRASSLVSRIILRLWALDGLAAGPSDAEVVRLAQNFLRRPHGWAAWLPVTEQERERVPPDPDAPPSPSV
jgi:hypothetical protein